MKGIKWYRNKYVLVIAAVFMWLVLLEDTNLFKLYDYRKQISNLEKEKDYYKSQIVETQNAIEELSSDPVKLEKFAREEYLMKKDNEDIFIISKGE